MISAEKVSYSGTAESSDNAGKKDAGKTAEEVYRVLKRLGDDKDLQKEMIELLVEDAQMGMKDLKGRISKGDHAEALL
ncbi:MAG TPA: hypothetical protein DEA47_02905 [Peptococcaceae bacterium]|nr:MAG: hypothetical protein XD50_1449 [Clostridia bacterium 41_269]HBT20306.1 hypothetical protein [Peptococcaceae bacterium]